jgi:hypothetical protein
LRWLLHACDGAADCGRHEQEERRRQERACLRGDAAVRVEDVDDEPALPS